MTYSFTNSAKRDKEALSSLKKIAKAVGADTDFMDKTLGKGVEVIREPDIKIMADWLKKMADTLQRYENEADTLTQKGYENYIKDIIKKTTREKFESEFNGGFITGNEDEDRRGFTIYVTQHLHANIAILTLIEKHRGLDKKIRGWIDKHVQKHYPPSPWGKTIQGEALHRLMQVGRDTDIIENDAMIYEFGNISFRFGNRSKHGNIAMAPATKLLQYFVHSKIASLINWKKIRQNGGINIKSPREMIKMFRAYNVTFTVDEYMELTGQTSKKDTQKALKAMLGSLYDASFYAEKKIYIVKDKQKVEDKAIYRGRIYQGELQTERGGVFILTPSTDFLDYCLSTTPADYHKGIFKINNRVYKYALAIYMKLWEHYVINLSSPGRDRLMVKNLLAAVPDMPKYEELKANNERHYDKRIIEPFEKNLNELARLELLTPVKQGRKIIASPWEYSNAKGEPLTPEQLKGMNYQEWEQLYITYNLNMPSQEKYIENYKKKLEASTPKTPQKKGRAKNDKKTSQKQA